MSCPVCSCRDFVKKMESQNGYWVCGCGYATAILTEQTC
jgi:ferredoxin-thioredoxin reductase catalytic subunit